MPEGTEPAAAGTGDRGDGIPAFWQWWEGDGAALAGRAVTGRADGEELQALTDRIAHLDPGLQWELLPGAESAHLLVVTAAGDPDLRALARAWLQAAPDADLTWSYADLRPADPEAAQTVLEFAGRQVALTDFVVAAQRGNTAIDIAVHHPIFMDIGEEEAAQLTYLALDSFLGERSAETWIGAVSWPGEAPLDAFPLRHLGTIVADFAAGHRDEQGEPVWLMLRGTGPAGLPVLAMAQVPLRQITFPLYDTHLAITLPYAERTDEGLPGPRSLEALRAVEDRIAVALGPHGRVVAHQSHDGVRLLHAYADGRSDAGDRVAALTAEWTEGEARTVLTPDPGWALVNHLAG